MRKPRTALDCLERIKRLKDAALDDDRPINKEINHDDLDGLPSVEKRIKVIFDTVNSDKRPKGNMLFFVMYDIENNKVRYYVAKYLQKQGCTRIQKSIFLGDLSHSSYENIRNDLAEIQSMYENHDSIIICPVATEQLKSMKVIGQNIDIDIIAHTKDILFF